MNKRLIAAMPLISTLLFLWAWLYLDQIELGVTFFLLIPLSVMLLTGNFFKRLSEVMPFIALLLFLWIGFATNTWHPTWLVFFLIPLTNIIVERKLDARKLVGITVTATYITIGLMYGAWHPEWIMFLLIPIINTLFFPQKNAYFNVNSDFKKNFRRVIIDDEDEDK
ncbi:MAG: hypothetical protein RBQ70_00555 [Acholeplasma sp.]|jgi:hypothetical protein|nr:hypothetical protein [Acholeplasma sp.]